MNFRNPILITFCVMVFILFAIGMYLMLTKNNEVALQNASSIILYCFSSVPLVMIGGIVLIILAFVFYILSNILVAYNRNITQSQVEIARALTENNKQPNRIIVNTSDKKSLQSRNQYQLPESSKQHRQIEYNGADLSEVPKLDLNYYLGND